MSSFGGPLLCRSTATLNLISTVRGRGPKRRTLVPPRQVGWWVLNTLDSYQRWALRSGHQGIDAEQDQLSESFEAQHRDAGHIVTRGSALRHRRLYYSAVLPLPSNAYLQRTDLAIYCGGVQDTHAIASQQPFSGGIGNDIGTICRNGSLLTMIPENVARST
jgi:hypothetical protein